MKNITIPPSKVDHFMKTLMEKKDAFIEEDMKSGPPSKEYYELLGWVEALEYVLNKFSEEQGAECNFDSFTDRYLSEVA